jgi:hypothetical protein
VHWPPQIGAPLPRAAEAVGAHRKLTTYSLDTAHKRGGSKARGFELILGITIENVGYLEGAIQTGILMTPISGVRIRPPYGIHCEVKIPVRGLGAKTERVTEVTTVWELANAGAAPRLVNAYIKG